MSAENIGKAITALGLEDRFLSDVTVHPKVDGTVN
jgi:hypothetical protein